MLALRALESPRTFFPPCRDGTPSSARTVELAARNLSTTLLRWCSFSSLCLSAFSSEVAGEDARRWVSAWRLSSRESTAISISSAASSSWCGTILRASSGLSSLGACRPRCDGCECLFSFFFERDADLAASCSNLPTIPSFERMFDTVAVTPFRHQSTRKLSVSYDRERARESRFCPRHTWGSTSDFLERGSGTRDHARGGRQCLPSRGRQCARSPPEVLIVALAPSSLDGLTISLAVTTTR